MIAIADGEVSFDDGLVLRAHAPIADFTAFAVAARSLPVHGWCQHRLGVHLSDKGAFDVEVTTGADERVEAIFLSHTHPFYEAETPNDSERRAFHEGVVAADLKGEWEFSWGQVLCRLNTDLNRDFLIVVYHKRSAHGGIASEHAPLD